MRLAMIAVAVSALLAGMLRGNPNIDRVFVYRGKARTFWKDYDFTDAAKDIPDNFLILPVLFNNTDRMVPHRTASLLQTFGLPQIWPVPRPMLYPEPPRGIGVFARVVSQVLATGSYSHVVLVSRNVESNPAIT